MNLATRCPSCNTVFRVAQDQLKASDGWVRCGRCQHVFSAMERLFDLGQRGAAASGKPQPQPKVSESVPPASVNAAAAATVVTNTDTDTTITEVLEEVSTPSSSVDVELAPHPVSAAPPPLDDDLGAAAMAMAAGAPVAAAVAAAVAELDDRPDPLAASAVGVAAQASDTPNVRQAGGGVSNLVLIEPDSAMMELEDGTPSELMTSKFIESDFVEDVSILSEYPGDAVDVEPIEHIQPTAAEFNEMLVPEAEREAVAAQGPPELGRSTAVGDGTGHGRSKRRSGWSPLSDGGRDGVEDAVLIEEVSPLGLRRPSEEQDVPVLDNGVSRFPQWDTPQVLPRATAESMLRESVSPPTAANEFIRSMPSGAIRRRSDGWVFRVSWLVLMVLLSITLVIQALVQWRDDLAADHPGMRPLLAFLCDVAGCGIEPPKRIHEITVESSELTRTGQGEFYQLNVVLRNRSDVPLSVPVLDLTLTDGEGGVISRRMLVGNEMHAAGETIPAQGDMPLHTLLTTPGKSLVGYTLEVFYP